MNMPRKVTAFYARVSSESQARDRTIDSQLADLDARARADGLPPDPERIFRDDGYSGSDLVRPGLERLRDAVAAGSIDRLYVHSPDRLARDFAHRILLIDEWQRAGVAVVFLNHDVDDSPEGNLLLQIQGVIAEYERAKILERGRRGRRHAARSGAIAALSGAPYGYTYVTKSEGGGRADYRVVLEEARVVRLIFDWVGREHLSLREVARRLRRQGVPTRTGKATWEPATLVGILKNPAYKGSAALGKTRRVGRRPRPRPIRGRPEFPRRNSCTEDTDADEQIAIPVPAIVDADAFDAAREQLARNRRRHGRPPRPGRYLVQGLVACARCGRAYYGSNHTGRAAPGGGDDPGRSYGYYRCWGTDGHRFDGPAVCSNRTVRSDRLDAATWDDVRGLLQSPARIGAEYRRRLESSPGPDRRAIEAIERQVQGVRRRIARLTEMYEEGYLDRDPFRARIGSARGKLAALEAEAQAAAAEASGQAELRLVIGQLEAFANQLRSGLADCDWETRRAIILALVKRIEIDEDRVRVVYKVAPDPLEPEPRREGDLGNCKRSEAPALQRSQESVGWSARCGRGARGAA